MSEAREKDADAPAGPGLPALPDRALAERLVADGIARWADARRARADAFVARHYSLKGSLALHRHALGWDVLRTPANLSLGAVQAGANLAASVARRAGADDLARRLTRRPVFLDTDLSRAVERLVMAEFLELPHEEGGRDSLAEAILADPRLDAALEATLAPLLPAFADPAFRARVEQAIGSYAGARAAAADMTVAIGCLAAGLAAFRQATPGVLSLTPLVASALARKAALSHLPAGVAAGLAAPVLHGAGPLTMLATGAGLFAAAAVGGTFAGIVADPVQARLGVHRRRLVRLVDAIEAQLAGTKDEPFVAREHYVARLLDLVDALKAVHRLAAR